MSIGIFCAMVSSLSLAAMILFDRLMMGDCYRNKADHAWIVSSIAGSSFGLIATILTWGAYSLVTGTPLMGMMQSAASLFFPYGILMILGGAITIQVMRHYFRLFMPDSEEHVNETAVAMWLAAVPLFIFITVALIDMLGLDRGVLSGLEHLELSPLFGGAVFLAVLAMMGFEYVSSGSEAFRFERVGEIGKMILCIVGYSVLISAVLRQSGDTSYGALVLQPFYWVGFASGARVLLNRTARTEFADAWRHIRTFLGVIIGVEIIGMVVYFFEFFALSGVDPTLVNLIVGAHIIPVFLCSIWLSSVRDKALRDGRDFVYPLGIAIERSTLPHITLHTTTVLWFIAVVVTLFFAVSLAHTSVGS